ncbi:hypothetical protein HGRIS_002037 [Hohenbuehelia grisea]|uniref:Protein prenyltransferase alpha subunit repeat-containing protein 1 n=1 Tax=Hohenbuehelia grisea TaxID=104357 RepID=A0ABR3JJ89_9AGAR
MEGPSHRGAWKRCLYVVGIREQHTHFQEENADFLGWEQLDKTLAPLGTLPLATSDSARLGSSCPSLLSSSTFIRATSRHLTYVHFREHLPVRHSSSMAQLDVGSVYAIGNALHAHDLISIEILPGSAEQWLPVVEGEDGQDFLLVEGNLGIPQKTLYRLYLIAVNLFRDSDRRNMPNSSSERVSNLLAITIVLLFTNPAHVTALNCRKRLVQGGMRSAEQELATFAMLQANKSCAKESILWDYRKWLLQRLGSKAQAISLQIPAAALEQEFRLLSKAVDVYPRNYHAWTHRRFCIEACLALSCREVGANPSEYARLLFAEYTHLRNWIRQHVSDHSAVHCLHGLVSIYTESSPAIVESFEEISAKSLVEESISLVTSYPEHESLWLYLRASITLEVDDHARQNMIALVKGLPDSAHRHKQLCIAWLEMSSQGQKEELKGLPGQM